MAILIQGIFTKHDNLQQDFRPNYNFNWQNIISLKTKQFCTYIATSPSLINTQQLFALSTLNFLIEKHSLSFTQKYIHPVAYISINLSSIIGSLYKSSTSNSYVMTLLHRYSMQKLCNTFPHVIYNIRFFHLQPFQLSTIQRKRDPTTI